MKERFVGVHWAPSVPWTEKSKLSHPRLQLYQIYGGHPVYGEQVLLYIGMSGNGAETRFGDHDREWVRWLPSAATVTAACLKEFSSWAEYNDKKYEDEYFEEVDTPVLRTVESLLIYGHQPVYNTQGRQSIPDACRGFRVFNTGAYRSLVPEISYFGLVDEL